MVITYCKRHWTNLGHGLFPSFLALDYFFRQRCQYRMEAINTLQGMHIWLRHFLVPKHLDLGALQYGIVNFSVWVQVKNNHAWSNYTLLSLIFSCDHFYSYIKCAVSSSCSVNVETFIAQAELSLVHKVFCAIPCFILPRLEFPAWVKGKNCFSIPELTVIHCQNCRTAWNKTNGAS